MGIGLAAVSARSALSRANASVAREASFGSVLQKRSARATLVAGSDQKAPSTFNTEFGPENGRVPLPFNPMGWGRTPHGREKFRTSRAAVRCVRCSPPSAGGRCTQPRPKIVPLPLNPMKWGSKPHAVPKNFAGREKICDGTPRNAFGPPSLNPKKEAPMGQTRGKISERFHCLEARAVPFPPKARPRHFL